MHGYTQREALNRYLLVNGNKENFGDRRVYYNVGYHRKTPFVTYVKKLGNPDMIYEYQQGKTYGIKIFYIKTDSVYDFGCNSRGCISMGFKGPAKISYPEKLAYDQLVNKN